MKLKELRRFAKVSPSGFYIGDMKELEDNGRMTYLMLVYASESLYGENIIDPEEDFDEVEDQDNCIHWKVEDDNFADGFRLFDVITEDGEKWHIRAEYDLILPRREGKLPGQVNTMYFVEVPKEWYEEAK